MLNTMADLKKHKTKFNKVLNSLEIKYFTQGKEWEILKSTNNHHNKLIRNLTRNIISTRDNKHIINYSYTYFYTNIERSLTKYNY